MPVFTCWLKGRGSTINSSEVVGSWNFEMVYETSPAALIQMLEFRKTAFMVEIVAITLC